MENQNRSDSYRVNWSTVKAEWPLWILMAGFLFAGMLVYPHLPAQVPGHWNIHGEIDAYYPRWFGAFFEPLLAIGLYLLMLFMPLIDPRRDNYARFTGAYTFMRWLLVLFLGILWVVTVTVALGYPVNVALAVKAAVAVLLIVIGNFMGQFRHNYFVGIKNPWTLANEEVWYRTHRMAARIWVLGGLLCLAMSFFQTPWAAYVYLGSVLIMVIMPTIYSYLMFVKLK
ncbi:SdpI family protein [Syntrophomonas curvata]